MTTKMEAVVIAVAKAREGVGYSAKGGARCPLCGKRCKVVSSPKWDGDVKIRYHRCSNEGCTLCKTGVNVKSVQEA